MRPLAKQILTFLLLVFGFSCLPYYLMIHTGHIDAGNGFAVFLVTAPVGRALYVTTEFGAGLALTVGAFALYFWTRRKEVMSLERDSRQMAF